MRIIIASNNNHKVQEIKDMLKPLGYDILSLGDAGIEIEVEEDRDTFMGNAYKKASEIYKTLNAQEKKDTFVLSDDSGLAVDYLGGEPGVYSARYSGEQATTEKNNEKLLKALEGVRKEDRSARFICAMVLLGEDREICVEGESFGFITEGMAGEGGFGYDPLFYSMDLGKTFGESLAEEKNLVSHRARALEKLVEELRKS
ncbi:MAG TPA: RdgB/HAM1 family non-canonical purine NTP pyrophosphatase [Clostridiaceae bacterium]|nr:RdgB/HAM1 family non-canonical purine NTP pyrophosphatase [Clostridiaceae bacterium]